MGVGLAGELFRGLATNELSVAKQPLLPLPEGEGADGRYATLNE
jgi:hypothetical protein